MSQKVIQSLFSYSMYHKIPTLFELITEQAKPIAPRCLNVQLTFSQKQLPFWPKPSKGKIKGYIFSYNIITPPPPTFKKIIIFPGSFNCLRGAPKKIKTKTKYAFISFWQKSDAHFKHLDLWVVRLAKSCSFCQEQRKYESLKNVSSP